MLNFLGKFGQSPHSIVQYHQDDGRKIYHHLHHQHHHHHQPHHEQHQQNVATVGKNLGSYSRLAAEMKEVSGQLFDNLHQDHDFSPLCITLVALV